MKKVIEALRGVIGVSGVILWDRTAQYFHKLLPGRYDGEKAEALCARLAAFCTDTPRVKRITARFQGGWIWMLNDENFGLLILAKPDLSTTTLNLVLKSSIATLQSQLRSMAPVEIVNASFTPEHVPALARTINLSLGYFQGEVSRFEIAEVLRVVKDKLIGKFPVLKHFTVDANGGVIIIRGAQRNVDASAVPATAALIRGFLGEIKGKTNIVGFDIEELTIDLQPTLNEIGFYQWFSEARRLLA